MGRDCLSGFQSSKSQTKTIKIQARADKTEIKSLKRDLRYIEKGLAETAALLVLRKNSMFCGGRQRGALTSLDKCIN